MAPVSDGENYDSRRQICCSGVAQPKSTNDLCCGTKAYDSSVRICCDDVLQFNVSLKYQRLLHEPGLQHTFWNLLHLQSGSLGQPQLQRLLRHPPLRLPFQQMLPGSNSLRTELLLDSCVTTADLHEWTFSCIASNKNTQVGHTTSLRHLLNTHLFTSPSCGQCS